MPGQQNQFPTILTMTTPLLLLAACLLSLLPACTTAEEDASGTPMLTATQTIPATVSATPVVELTVGKTYYEKGERVQYTVTNRAKKSVWYLTGDCSIRDIVRVEEDGEIELSTYLAEEAIYAKELPAGESFSCAWNQRAFWSPQLEDPERFAIGEQSFQVPPGRYQFKFAYGFEEDAVNSRPPNALTLVKSPVFTIE